ncbi:MAG: hypothetical protein ACXWC4_08065 [Telluria sp.]
MKFFAQRLDEMLFDYSLDSYKAPALNAPYLTREALALITDIEEGVLDYANLSHVLEELVWSVQNDRLAKSLLDSDIEYYTAIANAGELPSLKLRLEVLERTLNPHRYREAVFVELGAKIVAGEKQAIDSLARTLITTLINTGVSKQYIYTVLQQTFFQEGPPIQDESVIHVFFEAISARIHTFDVLLIASKNIEQVAESISAFRLTIAGDHSPEMRETALAHQFAPGEDEIYILATGIEAHDVYSARQRAIYNLDRLGDLLTLFQHRSRIVWRQEAVVSQRCCDDQTFWITPPAGPMEKAADLRPQKAAKELNTLIKSFSAKGISFRKFNRVADIHGICVNHNIVDNQLVNLWTALETLTPSNAGTSKIGNVTAAALPFLMHAYVGRLVQQLTYDLLNWDKWRAKKLLHKVPCDPKTPLRGKCLRLLCLPENEPLRGQLYEHLKDFHLLRFRIFRFAETLSDRKKLRDLLTVHEKKVSWQIRRIYRTRNLIVHSGRIPPPYINTLVENGHDYLDSIIFEVMKTSCGLYSATSLEQVFEIAKIRHQGFLRKLADNAPLTTANCDFLLGEQNVVVV